jgi:hypothetical protein
MDYRRHDVILRREGGVVRRHRGVDNMPGKSYAGLYHEARPTVDGGDDF